MMSQAHSLFYVNENLTSSLYIHYNFVIKCAYLQAEIVVDLLLK